MNQQNIAIFGSTGHIGKNLFSFFSKNKNTNLFLFSRDIKKFESLKTIFSTLSNFYSYNDFEKNHYDVIINCIGISNPIELMKNNSSILHITEFYDNMILNYLKIHPTTCYINLSSGAVYGQEFRVPVSDNSISKLKINKINPGEMYSISKIYSESKHRLLPDFNIVDLRIFGFFSKFIDVNSGFFMSELIKSLINKSEFVTDKENIVRDYVSPTDFYDLIKNCISFKKINDVFDIYSKKPVSKFQLLEAFVNKFDLKFKSVEKNISKSPTGFKKNYYSLSRKVEKINYYPKSSSFETIIAETNAFLEDSKFDLHAS
jgi:nucleoside-diphosphate-sugar epimerase